MRSELPHHHPAAAPVPGERRGHGEPPPAEPPHAPHRQGGRHIRAVVASALVAMGGAARGGRTSHPRGCEVRLVVTAGAPSPTGAFGHASPTLRPMDEANFDQIVEDALGGLPKWATAELDNVVVLVKEELFGPPAPWSFAQYASP